MMAQRETGSSSQIIFITPFIWEVLGFASLLPGSVNNAKMLSQNHFAKPSQHVLTFLHSILI